MKEETRLQKRKDWASHVGNWKASGQSQAAYCSAQGLKLNTFKDWVVKIRKDGGLPAKPKQGLSWVPVKVQVEETSSNLILRAVNRWQLELPAKVCPHWLGQLLRELGGC
ncbi:Uncharacterized protein MCB1EB_1379 [Mycoavidus cysteinexigens]|uniref:Uncharacterized protein n=1 Tax=Mycoavidus cysteinexigens TaxID=1553431 RepID=A0A2Z6EVQ8_9BURK|nr:hypothetical protein [Mycoavidus cysteinexigens]BBE09540.1 Uncharacterized protein MCB1EB_1379 [Mycoavidus cysteinexigens]GLR01759.1 hypothetical protein GCM10007934_15710 [Mycoavidus cysteinexigens]